MSTSQEHHEAQDYAAVSPTPMGVNLRPIPPKTKHMSKRLGVVIFIVLFALVGFIIYGIFARHSG